MPNPNTPIITPPRVPLVDPRTGLIDRAWYLFFLSLNNVANAVVDDVVGPSIDSLIASYDAALQTLAQEVGTQPAPVDLSAEIIKQLEAAGLVDQSSALLSQVAELQKQVEGLQAQPVIDAGAITVAIAALFTAPAVKVADFTVASNETWLINNKSGSTCTVTLPSASTGQVLHFQNYQTQALVSASSNVVPLAGGAAGTSILLASSGDSATLVSDGSNWLMTQYVPNNILLLE